MRNKVVVDYREENLKKNGAEIYEQRCARNVRCDDEEL